MRMSAGNNVQRNAATDTDGAHDERELRFFALLARRDDPTPFVLQRSQQTSHTTHCNDRVISSHRMRGVSSEGGCALASAVNVTRRTAPIGEVSYRKKA